MATAVVSCTGENGLLKGLEDGQDEGGGFSVPPSTCRSAGGFGGVQCPIALLRLVQVETGQHDCALCC